MDVISTSVVTTAKSFFTTCKLFVIVNHTDITLISKISNFTSLSDFRPISQCNFNYTIISKVLANMLKPYMSDMITPFESAFVVGRMIQDNIIIAHEVFHHIINHKNGQQVECAVKLDMQKAYNRVEWDFLLEMLARRGFSPK